MNAIEQAKSALEAAKHFTEDMHILPPEWCADESVKLKVRLESALAALSAPAQMTDAEIADAIRRVTGFPDLRNGELSLRAELARAIESRALSSAAGQEPTWQQAERIRDVHEVDMALENFAHDSTADNATGLVLAVMKATAAPAQPQVQPVAAQQDGWKHYFDVPDALADKALAARVPGGSSVRDWFLPHDTEKGAANVRDAMKCALLEIAAHPSQAPQQEAGQARRSDESIIKTAQHMEAKRADFETKFKVDIWAVYGWLNENGFEPLALYERKSAQKGGGQ